MTRDLIRTRDDVVGCPVCLHTESDLSKFTACSGKFPTDLREALILLWRKDREGRWHAVVMTGRLSSLAVEVLPAEQLEPLVG
ncbi:hypothetical protein [Actinomadura roseirufa]|uniref:hypothetical protein n=1 Tax=Actinomadura roseirufa TaxID=2094049 RepID=UPI0010411B78|nr:hypothetical protein [Actinomadura roseirufa]